MTTLNDKYPDIAIGESQFRLLNAIKSFMKEYHVDGYLVGGFIRDNILKRDIDDIDIAIAADSLAISPLLAQQLNAKCIPMDKTNKVTRIILKDAETAEPQHVDVSTIINNIEDDLARRDFTVDAMAVSLDNVDITVSGCNIIDPFYGRRDIEQKTLRTVCDKSFEADPLRLLRAVRLAAEADFPSTAERKHSLKKQSGLISNVAGERIREELLQLLDVPEAGNLFLYMEEMGLISAMMPELIPSKEWNSLASTTGMFLPIPSKTIDAVDYILGNTASGNKWRGNSNSALVWRTGNIF
jgi:poly(A) polymerase